MAEEWRLSIDFGDHAIPGRWVGRGRRARDTLRRRFSDDMVISTEKQRLLLYTERDAVARQAELTAHQVLADHGLSAQVRLDRWDPSEHVWRDAQSGEPERGAAGPLRPGRAPLTPEMAEAVTSVIAAGLDAIGLIP